MTLTYAQQAAVIKLAPTGRPTPDAVVDAAADPTSPLHGLFEWDDAKAGHAYRVEQARKVITAVVYHVPTSSTEFLKAPLYVRDPDLPPTMQGYVSVALLQTDAEKAQRAIRQELERVMSLLRRVRVLATTLGIETDVDGLLTQVMAIESILSNGPSTVDVPATQ